MKLHWNNIFVRTLINVMRQERDFNRLQVLYRISDNGYKNKIKPYYVTKIDCLKNALLAFNSPKTQFTIYVDSVIESTDKAIHELCDSMENVTIKYLNLRSNGKSFLAVLNDACTLQDDDYVYFVEDDHIHLKDTFSVLSDAIRCNYTDYIALYDHPDKYDRGCKSINPLCRDFGEHTCIFRTNNHHWKISNSTVMTFGAFADVLKRDKKVFEDIIKGDAALDYEIFTRLRNEGKYLSTPIPSLSTHGETDFLAPFIDWEQVMLEKKHKCCIAIITHKEKLEGVEEASIKQAIKIFGGKRDIFLVLPNKVNTDYYKQYEEFVKIIKVNDSWLDSIKSYNRTLCSSEFYELFKDYEYMLIYQTDCWVFDDRLDYFMSLGYDYYGAPWPHHGDTVGNGGFSLRKVNKMLEITNKYTYRRDSLGGNEDTWFCQTHKNDLNLCDLNTACNFSIEAMTSKYKDMILTRPMGLHGMIVKTSKKIVI